MRRKQSRKEGGGWREAEEEAKEEEDQLCGEASHHGYNVTRPICSSYIILSYVLSISYNHSTQIL